MLYYGMHIEHLMNNVLLHNEKYNIIHKTLCYTTECHEISTAQDTNTKKSKRNSLYNTVRLSYTQRTEYTITTFQTM